MILSILANIIGAYSLLTVPYAMTQVIDSGYYDINGQIDLFKISYLKDAPYRLNNNSLGIKVTAKSAMIVDKKTGNILWQKRPDQQRSLASITKLMTALVFLDNNPGWNTVVKIEAKDQREGGRIRVYAGEEIYVKDLFNASLVASSNNATMALARSTGLELEQFVELMNSKAKELGMNNSVFVEPTGLDSNNKSTASDIIKLAREAFAKTEIKQATVRKEYNFSVVNVGRNYTLKNTDKLLNSYLHVNAGKTGYLDEAGYCLVSEIKGDDGQDILVVTLGSATEVDRFQEVKALAQWSFDNYRWPK